MNFLTLFYNLFGQPVVAGGVAVEFKVLLQCLLTLVTKEMHVTDVYVCVSMYIREGLGEDSYELQTKQR